MLRIQQFEQRIGGERTRIDDAGAAANDSQFDGQLEHMTEREDRERAIIRMDINHIERGCSVAGNVPMAEHDALWLACGT